MATVTIIGAGMMGSALAFPARENGNEVRLVGTPLDREIIQTCIRTGKHPKLPLPFPEGVKYFQIEDVKIALAGADMVIANGKDVRVIHRILEGRSYGTLFKENRNDAFDFAEFVDNLHK